MYPDIYLNTTYARMGTTELASCSLEIVSVGRRRVCVCVCEREREREMARCEVLVAVCALLIVCGAPAAAAEGRKATRRLNYSGYPKSGSSGVSPPYTSTPSGSSPDISTPTPDISTPSPDISTPSPDITTPTPDISTPSPDITTPTPDISSPTPDITTPSPVTSTPSGYGGYGSRSGCGTPKFWMGHPMQVPKFLSLLSTLAKLFGPRLLKLIGNRSMMGAIKDVSPEPMPSLAREASASLINAYVYKDFPLSASEVVTHFNNALSSPELAAEQALSFQRYNEAV